MIKYLNKHIRMMVFVIVFVAVVGCISKEIENGREIENISIPENNISSDNINVSNNIIPNRFTEEEKLITKIALDNQTVKEMIKGKQIQISSVSIVGSGDTDESGNSISGNLPGVQIYIGDKEWTSVIEIIPLVNIEGKNVVRILKYNDIPAIFPVGLSDEDKEKAIKIALSDKQIKEKMQGRNYEILEVVEYENRFTGKIGHTQVLVHIKGTGKVYYVNINLMENKVIDTGELGNIDEGVNK